MKAKDIQLGKVVYAYEPHLRLRRSIRNSTVALNRCLVLELKKGEALIAIRIHDVEPWRNIFTTVRGILEGRTSEDHPVAVRRFATTDSLELQNHARSGPYESRTGALLKWVPLGHIVGTVTEIMHQRRELEAARQRQEREEREARRVAAERKRLEEERLEREEAPVAAAQNVVLLSLALDLERQLNDLADVRYRDRTKYTTASPIEVTISFSPEHLEEVRERLRPRS